jgi:hypothetical protein
MPLLLLRNIYHALIVNRITFCLSAWGGFVTIYSVGRLNAVFKRAKRYGFTDTVFDIIGLLENADCLAKLSSIIIIVCTIFYLLVDRTLVAYVHEVTISPCQNALIL